MRQQQLGRRRRQHQFRAPVIDCETATTRNVLTTRSRSRTWLFVLEFTVDGASGVDKLCDDDNHASTRNHRSRHEKWKFAQKRPNNNKMGTLFAAAAACSSLAVPPEAKQQLSIAGASASLQTPADQTGLQITALQEAAARAYEAALAGRACPSFLKTAAVRPSASGGSNCEHGRQWSQCKDCWGSGICQHGRERRYCKDCGGSSICQHGRKRNYCKDCGGSSICQHGRQKRLCKECGGSSGSQQG